ncbi:MAG TPA: hypothetical protein VNS58_02860 [Puia sp.]|nr:hypothetical protein [Puia sp.]
MKNTLLLLSILCLFSVLSACKKSGGDGSSSPSSSFVFSANDSMISFPVNLAYLQDVYDVHTTLISGQYKDTSTRKGNISFRLIGDTTGRYQGDSLLVTYTNAAGDIYYNTGDSTNFVLVNRFEKKYNGIVSGSFNLKVSNSSGSIQFSQGSFTAIYQD